MKIKNMGLLTPYEDKLREAAEGKTISTTPAMRTALTRATGERIPCACGGRRRRWILAIAKLYFEEKRKNELVERIKTEINGIQNNEGEGLSAHLEEPAKTDDPSQ